MSMYTSKEDFKAVAKLSNAKNEIQARTILNILSFPFSTAQNGVFCAAASDHYDPTNLYHCFLSSAKFVLLSHRFNSFQKTGIVKISTSILLSSSHFSKLPEFGVSRNNLKHFS